MINITIDKHDNVVITDSRGQRRAFIMANTHGCPVMVEDLGWLSQWPCFYDDGTVGYDRPEMVPQYVKRLAMVAYAIWRGWEVELRSP